VDERPEPEPDPSCPSCAALSARLDRIAELVGEQALVIAKQGEVIAKQGEVIAKQGEEIERLKARKPKTSRTSSKPPSSDGPWSKYSGSKRAGSGKKRGGQPGHKGKTRKPAPPEDVDEVKMVRPEHCGSCNAPLVGDDPSPRIHQVIDIPSVDPEIVEYRLHQPECMQCGAATRAALPGDVHQSAFGPNLSALIVLLSGEYRMSRRNIQRFIADSYGIEVSLGAISNVEGRMAEGLAGPHAEALASVAASPTKHLDETTWREFSELAWLWVAVGEEATVFVIRDSRASAVARELIGDEPSGIVVSDRYSGYAYIDLDQRQVCLANLIRDFRRMAEGEKDLRWIGERLLGLIGALFRLWHLHLAEEIDRATLKRWSRGLRVRMIRLLDEGATSVGYETPGMCRGILRTEPAMWTFVEREGVEPTNNVAERAIRPAVILRKTSLGTQSERGSRYVERMQTTSATLRQAGRSLRDFIVDVAHAVLQGGPSPKLLS